MVTAAVAAEPPAPPSSAPATGPPAAAPRASAWHMPTGAPPQGPPQVQPAPVTSYPVAAAYGPSPARQTYTPYVYPSPYGPAFQQGPPDAAESPEEEEPSPPFFDISLNTIVPLSLGGQLSLEVPGRILLQGDLGWMPGFYGSAVNGLVSSFGVQDPAVQALVEGALGSAFVARVSAGWRPFPDAGFEITGGYTSISLSGEVSVPDLAAIIGGNVAAELAREVGVGDAELSSQLHNFHVALGWRWVALEHLVIRANIGYTQTLGSSSSVDIPGQPEATALANPVVDETLDGVYTSYVKLPFLALSGGYRF